MATFGEYVKILRTKKGITLRKFCMLTETDPSNWSKIERNKLQPPKSKKALQKIARVLELKKDSEEWDELMDLVMIASIPKELVANEKIITKLPIFFRTIRGQKPSKEELDEILKLLKET